MQASRSLPSMKLHRHELRHLEITIDFMPLANYFSMSENTQTAAVLGSSLLTPKLCKYQRVINLCRTAVTKLEEDQHKHITILAAPLPTRSSCPKTVFSPRAEQFHLPYRNWYWHSLIPICAPSPITMMASGRLWQIARCRGARPGILLQMILAPKATTEDKALKKKSRKTCYNQIEAINCFCHVAGKALGKRGRVGSWVLVIMPTYPNLPDLSKEVGNLSVTFVLICARKKCNFGSSAYSPTQRQQLMKCWKQNIFKMKKQW